MLMSLAFSRDTVRESFQEGQAGEGEMIEPGEKKKDEPTRQSANLHTLHTSAVEGVSPRGEEHLDGIIALSR